MKFLVCSILVVLLAACGGPSGHFRDAEVTRIAVEGSTFDVRVRGNLAESIRINSQYAPRLGPIRERAATAMAQVSGCQVTGVLGDQVVQIGQLSCGDAVVPDWRTSPQYECLEVPSGVKRTDGEEYLDFDCSAY